jgi:hypothetical protein
MLSNHFEGKRNFLILQVRDRARALQKILTSIYNIAIRSLDETGDREGRGGEEQDRGLEESIHYDKCTSFLAKRAQVGFETRTSLG